MQHDAFAAQDRQAQDRQAHDHDGAESPAQFWERRYAGTEPIWSGKVNATLAEAVSGLVPGRSLDLGSGEGGDVLWLAEQGWEASGIDLSPTAVARARNEAKSRGVERAEFIARDLNEWAASANPIHSAPHDGARYELITASFFQSPVELQRAEILRAALSRLAPGGRLVLVSHASPPSWAVAAGGAHGGGAPGEGGVPGRDSTDGRRPTGPTFYQPEDELRLLGLSGEASSGQNQAGYEIETAKLVQREVADPEGRAAWIEDSLVVVRRG